MSLLPGGDASRLSWEAGARDRTLRAEGAERGGSPRKGPARFGHPLRDQRSLAFWTLAAFEERRGL